MLGCLQTDERGKFISSIVKSFCNERGINIGYMASYVHEENGIVEQYWKSLATMKDSLLIESRLSVNF